MAYSSPAPIGTASLTRLETHKAHVDGDEGHPEAMIDRADIVRLARSLKSSEAYTFAVKTRTDSAARVTVADGSMSMFTRKDGADAALADLQVTGEYPPLERLHPRSDRDMAGLTVEGNTLYRITEGLAKMMGPAGEKITVVKMLLLDEGSEHVVMTQAGREEGISIKVPCHPTPAELAGRTTGFTPALLMDSIRSTRATRTQQITLWMDVSTATSHTKPVLFRMAGDDPYNHEHLGHLLVPVRAA